MNNDINSAIINGIKKELQQSINKEYTEYKEKCLKDLDYKLEAVRNETVKSILDGIDVNILEQQPYSLDPVIMIKVEKKIIVKGE